MRNIYWVGALDWNVRDFHGYTTYKGTTYNSFLVLDEKVALFDTVKEGFWSELLHRIRVIVEPSRIDYIVINHVEPDHSGALPRVFDIIRPEKIICSPMGRKALIDHHHREDWPYHVVKSGDSVSLGERTVQFIETRMVHWPDSMFSYIPQHRLLISSDAFGQHWCTGERFDDEVDASELFFHARKYYANILLPYNIQVQKTLNALIEMGLDIQMIAPDHGLIWRRDNTKIVDAYARWCSQTLALKAVVIYDTMWNSTEIMAKAVASGLMDEGISVHLLSLKHNHRSDIMTELLDAGAIIIGSPTLNNGMLPSVADVLHYIRGLRPKDRIGAAFGSYGWSGEAVNLIIEQLQAMKLHLIHEGIKVRYVPDHGTLRECVELGRQAARRLKEKISPTAST